MKCCGLHRFAQRDNATDAYRFISIHPEWHVVTINPWSEDSRRIYAVWAGGCNGVCQENKNRHSAMLETSISDGSHS